MSHNATQNLAAQFHTGSFYFSGGIKRSGAHSLSFRDGPHSGAAAAIVVGHHIASSRWREPLALRGLKESAQESHYSSSTSSTSGAAAAAAAGSNPIKRGSMASQFQLGNATCMALHNELNFAVQGSTDQELQIVKILPVATESQVDYRVLLRCRVGSPVHSIAYHGDWVMVGGGQGKAYVGRFNSGDLRDMKQDRMYSTTAQRTENVTFVEYTHPNGNGSGSAAPSPEQWSYSSRINAIDINHSVQGEFFTLENNRLHVWNTERTLEPVHTIKGSNSPLLCGQWNPRNPNELIIGGTSRGLKLLDLRHVDSPSASRLAKWTCDFAHLDSIRDVKWNPLIPYWVASAGNDSIVNIWDIRYNSGEPIVSLHGHDNLVRSVSWSRVHAEMLATGSIDQTLKLWSLKLEPHHVLTAIGHPFSESVISVAFSAYRPNQCIAMSSCGELVTCTLSPSFLTPLVFSRFSSAEDDEREIEKLIYLRQLAKAYQMITEKAKVYKSQNRLDRAIRLLELVQEKTLSRARRSDDQKKRFLRELNDFAYFIPPNFPAEYIKVPDERIREVDNLVLNCQILLYVQRNDFKGLVKLEKQIIELLEQDMRCIEVSTLQEVADLYLAHDYGLGMTFLIKVCSLYKQNHEFAYVESVPRRFLSPTTFEAQQNPSLQESAYRSLTKIMSDPDSVINQLVLQRDAICALWEPNSALRIVEIVENSSLSGRRAHEGYLDTIISVSVMRTYLNALLCLKRYDRFFIVSAYLLTRLQGFDFAQVLRAIVEDVFNNTFTALINMTLAIDLDDSLDDRDILEYLHQCRATMVQTLNIAQFCPFVLDIMKPMLTKSLDHLEKALVFCLQKLADTVHGETEAVAYIKDFMRQLEIERGRHGIYGPSESEEVEETPLQLQVKKVRNVLIGFLENKHHGGRVRHDATTPSPRRRYSTRSPK